MDVSEQFPPASPNWASQFITALRSQCEHVRELLIEHQTRHEEIETQLERRIEELIAATEAQHTAALAQVHELETQLAAVAQSTDAERPAENSDAEDNDFQRRYEMALDDLRELKSKNSELQQQMAHLRNMTTANAVVSGPVGGGLNWEAEKARILAALESESADDAPEQQAERLNIENVVRVTDDMIAEKERRIEELEQQLAQSTPVVPTAAAPDATSTAALLDHDEIIVAERAKLEKLQEEWREKLRQAEIEVSLERAKIARQRVELEARLQHPQDAAEPATTPGTMLVEKPAHGRWLARLGLTDAPPPKVPPLPR